jgi:hypothetical protein
MVKVGGKTRPLPRVTGVDDRVTWQVHTSQFIRKRSPGELAHEPLLNGATSAVDNRDLTRSNSLQPCESDLPVGRSNEHDAEDSIVLQTCRRCTVVWIDPFVNPRFSYEARRDSDRMIGAPPLPPGLWGPTPRRSISVAWVVLGHS